MVYNSRAFFVWVVNLGDIFARKLLFVLQIMVLRTRQRVTFRFMNFSVVEFLIGKLSSRRIINNFRAIDINFWLLLISIKKFKSSLREAATRARSVGRKIAPEFGIVSRASPVSCCYEALNLRN